MTQDSASGHPIGHGHAEPIAEKQECAVLDHESEAQHLASIVRGSTDLKTSDEFKGLLVSTSHCVHQPTRSVFRVFNYISS